MVAFSLAIHAQQAPSDGLRYAGTACAAGEYREWVFLSSGLGMNYNAPPPEQVAPARQFFTNVL
jgi:hypothetical protein